AASRRRERPADRHDLERGQRAAAAALDAHRRLVERVRALHEGDADEMRPGRHGHRERERLRTSTLADRRLRDAYAVDRDLDLMRLARVAREIELERVIGVEREPAL